MATVSSSSLVDALRQYRLLEPTQLEELKNLQARFADPKALAKELITRSCPLRVKPAFAGASTVNSCGMPQTEYEVRRGDGARPDQ